MTKKYYVRMMNRIIGLDPGSEESGMVVIDGSSIIAAFNLSNEQFYCKVTNYLLHPNTTIVIEDLAAYSLRLTPQVISAAKFIGECLYRLKIEAGANVVLIQRSKVKKWCFDTFPFVCNPIIEKKIEKKNQRDKDGNFKKPHFFYIDDKSVTECMKYLYKISLPLPGKGYDYGLQTHSWQALAVASCFLHSGDSHQLTT